MTTSSKQKAKNGARLASLAANPATLSKNPTLLETSLGRRVAVGFLLMKPPSCDVRRIRAVLYREEPFGSLASA
jgi:hypothetical protein